MKKFLTALLILTLPATANAVTLQEAARIALENNPSLQNTGRSIEIAEENLRIAQGNKGFSVSASGSGTISKTEGNPDSQSVSARLRGSLPIYSGKRLESQIEAAKIGIDISKLDYLQAQDDLIYQVAKVYIDALENWENTQVYLQTEQNLADHERNIAAMYDAGATAKIDLLRAQVETANAQQDTAKSHAAYEVSLSNLATLMAIDSISNLTVEHVATSMELGDLENYLDAANQNRYDLQADALKIDRGEYSVEAARAGKRPSLSAEVSTGVSASKSEWHPTPDASAGLSASWNIFDSHITDAEIKQAEIELDQLYLQMKNDLNSAHEEVVTAHKNLRIALMRLRTTKKAVELAEEERYIAVERYRAGEGILLDVLDAEVALSTAKKNHVSATYDVARYKFDLSHAIGNTLAALN
ncbi:MAG: TolC family protein [Selenomonadaceae bacterium]|nr:TolC family protein [Selenomonadaceae bacterium]